jgi:hypothetical protein
VARQRNGTTGKDIPAPRASSALMMLEIKTLVKRLPGNAYARAGYG